MTFGLKSLAILSLALFVSGGTSEKCGKQVASHDIITNDRHAKIGQYPWSALIEYKKGSDNDDQTHMLCGGTLISSSYVLTAAHCVTGPAATTNRPTSIRLGDYDIKNEGPDCIQGVCTDGAISIPIDKITVHPQYSVKTRRVNIALIKLKTQAPYTDFIRPVCLPTEDFTVDTLAGFPLHAAGWENENDTSGSQTKKQFPMPFVPLKECNDAYVSKRTSLIKGQFCAGGGENACGSRLGAPVMIEKEETTSLVGMFSFGPTSCAASIPEVFTNVFEYVDWIKDNME